MMKISLIDAQTAIINYKDTFKSRSARHILESLRGMKASAIASNDKSKLREVRGWICLLQAQEHYFSAFEKCLQREYYKAWCDLEVSITFIERLPSSLDVKILECIDFLKKKISKLQTLYPYKMFGSPEYIFKRKCTICDSYVNYRKKCEHLPGSIYDGKLCKYAMTDFEFLAMALVENPVQKYSVPFAKDEATGKHFDHYDYKLLDYLFSGIRNPFEHWDYEIQSKAVPTSKFKDLKDDVSCPCISDKKYGECCKGKEVIVIQNLEFVISEFAARRIKSLGGKWRVKPPARNIGREFHIAIFHTTHEDLS
ncbi:hypothetical protein ACLWBD_00510 [Bdellovibrio sp. HCB117]|uniref:hypothetical protein n=1 Tax=Bdellovibrio sp. HCB117 TaxID=3394359 RepID=UPI0039B65480